MVAADLFVLKDGATQNIRAFVNPSQLPTEDDFISPVERDAITQSANQTPALDTPLMPSDDLKSFANPVPPKPIDPADADAERKAREAREAETRREAEQLERERKEQEERPRAEPPLGARSLRVLLWKRGVQPHEEVTYRMRGL